MRCPRRINIDVIISSVVLVVDNDKENGSYYNGLYSAEGVGCMVLYSKASDSGTLLFAVA